ncbi:MAG: 1-acyl-sn-glycerol-3-phosphate acyltransferase [Bacteroidaceae bacterium]|nr:1-acyl-sn-glycerol-3-phosphate acyltransferase [Bacteroidaceae bacterium]
MNYEFDSIRPYNDEEVRPAIESLLNDRQFSRILRSIAPILPLGMSRGMLKLATWGIHSTLQFQLRFMKPVVNYILRNCSTDHTFDHQAIEAGEPRYTFLSNHRDIVLDSAILDVMLHDAKFPTTCEIAIGDNLLIYPWIRTLVRLNKAFIVRRNISRHELYESSLLMSRYMHHVIQEKGENIWIAQREGRAKDSSDQTQVSLLKMMAMSNAESPVEAIKALHIVPLSISYEYDPCDYLKAKEFQQRRDDPAWKKSKQDDLVNMKTGIKGQKGHIHYHAAPCINAWIDELSDLPQKEFYTELAQRIDREIHRHYRLFPGNYVALDLLTGRPTHAEHYSHKEKVAFEQYLASRIALVDLPNRDEAFLRERLLTMYANPVINYEETR